MVKRLLSLLLISAITIGSVIYSGNSYEVQAEKTDETSEGGSESAVMDEELIKLLENAEPADKPAFCDGFGALTWEVPSKTYRKRRSRK